MFYQLDKIDCVVFIPNEYIISYHLTWNSTQWLHTRFFVRPQACLDEEVLSSWQCYQKYDEEPQWYQNTNNCQKVRYPSMLIHWTISIPCLLCFNVDVSIKDKTFVQSYYLFQKNLNFVKFTNNFHNFCLPYNAD